MGTIKHPSLPCTAFSEAAIKCRFFGLHRDPAEEPNSGVFAVVREARGHQATEPLERNLIVRDLLWLHRVGRQVRSKEPVGAYFSTVDNQGYVLDCVDPGINAITVSGLSHDISVGVTDPKPIKLDFRQRRSDFAFQHREALITGETRRMERPGAWKTLIIRPDWPDLERVEADLASINDVSNCHAFLSQSGRIGVLYSRHQVEENAPHANNMVARRHAFRGLIYGKDEPHGFSLAHEDRLKFEEAFVRASGQLQAILREHSEDTATQFARAVVDQLEAILNSSWPLLEPAQIILRKNERIDQRRSDVVAHSHLLGMLTEPLVPKT